MKKLFFLILAIILLDGFVIADGHPDDDKHNHHNHGHHEHSSDNIGNQKEMHNFHHHHHHSHAEEEAKRKKFEHDLEELKKIDKRYAENEHLENLLWLLESHGHTLEHFMNPANIRRLKIEIYGEIVIIVLLQGVIILKKRKMNNE